jgi:hypothetical protein
MLLLCITDANSPSVLPRYRSVDLALQQRLAQRPWRDATSDGLSRYGVRFKKGG